MGLPHELRRGTAHQPIRVSVGIEQLVDEAGELLRPLGSGGERECGESSWPTSGLAAREGPDVVGGERMTASAPVARTPGRDRAAASARAARHSGSARDRACGRGRKRRSLIRTGDLPKGVTHVSHTTKRGIYCIGLDTGIDPTAAIASLTFPSAGDGVSTLPNSTDCAAGELEVDTFILVQGDSNTPGNPLVTVLADGGFTVVVP